MSVGEFLVTHGTAAGRFFDDRADDVGIEVVQLLDGYPVLQHAATDPMPLAAVRVLTLNLERG